MVSQWRGLTVGEVCPGVKCIVLDAIRPPSQGAAYSGVYLSCLRRYGLLAAVYAGAADARIVEATVLQRVHLVHIAPVEHGAVF